jgi:hypothetical protein
MGRLRLIASELRLKLAELVPQAAYEPVGALLGERLKRRPFERANGAAVMAGGPAHLRFAEGFDFFGYLDQL